jgi:hypothetical protein
MPPRAAYRTKLRKPQQEGFFARLLDPIDRLSETIFSVLILLTFTLAYRVLNLGTDPYEPVPPDYLIDLVWAALGATVAWGFIDGVVYALLAVFERGEKHRFLARLQAASNEEEGVAAIADELGYVLEPITGEEQRQLLYIDVLDHLRDSQPQPVALTRQDFYGGLGCVLVAVLAVVPSLIPLVLLREHYWIALRVSNLVSVGVLFLTGYQWGKYSGSDPWKTGLLLAAIGVALAAVAIPLGG